MKKVCGILLPVFVSVIFFADITVASASEYTTGEGTSADNPKVTVSVTEKMLDNGGYEVTTTEKTSWADYGEMLETGSDYELTEIRISEKDSDGYVISEYGSEEGRESTSVYEMPELTVKLGGMEESTAVSDIQNTGGGDIDALSNYDITSTTVRRQREVKAYLSDISVTTGGENHAADTVMTPLLSVWDGDEQDVNAPSPDIFGGGDAVYPSGYEYRYTGWDKDSHYGAFCTVTYDVSDAAETAVSETVEKEGDILQFFLTDMANTEASDHTVYCADLNTSVREGWWYRIDNLETVDYYSDESAKDHIRAIANHGYWGTADGSTGSLSVFVNELQNAAAQGTESLLGHDFSLMTDGEAQAATQIAIWRYGNHFSGYTDMKIEASNFNGQYGWTADENDKAAWGRINAAADYLAGLSESAGDTTVVITEDKFIRDMSLTVGGAAENGAKGVYDASLSFTLSVAPGEYDSLVMRVLRSGNTVREIPLAAGQTEYTADGLLVSENEDIELEFVLTGVQHLNKGVYVYTPEVKEGNSAQTFVGIAEGDRSVDIKMAMILGLDVRDAIVATEHLWRSEWKNSIPAEKEPVDDQDILKEDITTVTEPVLPAETVTVSASSVPDTGDDTVLWYPACIIASCVAIASAIIVFKKRAG